jgi:hypothetical protein
VRKFISVLLVAIFLISGVLDSDIAYASDADITITMHKPMSGATELQKVPRNEKFNLLVMFENRSGKEIKDVRVTLDQENSAFYIADGVPTVYDIPVVDNAGNFMLANMMHKGTGNKVVLIFEYTKDGEEGQQAVKTVYINVDSSTPSVPGDQYSLSLDPVLEISDNFTMPVIQGGKNAELIFPVSNISLYTAMDVKITIDLGKLSEYITFSDLKTVKKFSTIAPRKTETVRFTGYVSKMVEPGIYPVTLRYEFSNIYQKSFQVSETVNIRVTNTYTKPDTEISNISVDKDRPAVGQEVKIRFTVTNTGSSDAKDTVLYLDDYEDDGFVVKNAANQVNIGLLKGNESAVVEFVLLKVRDGSSGIISMKVRTDYKDEKDSSHSKTHTVIPPFAAAPASSGSGEIVIESLSAPTENIEVGNEFTVYVKLKNAGSSVAKNIKVSVSPDGVLIPKSLSIITVDSLSPGQSQDFSFKLSPQNSASSKNYAIPVTVEYDTDKGGNVVKESIVRYVGVNVVNERSKVKTVPKIIIDNYEFDTENVNAGTEFVLKLHFLNTSKELATKNIKVTLVSVDGSFTPVASSNTFYIESIGPEQSVAREIKLYAKPDLTTKSYQMKATLQYEDEEGVQDPETGRQYEAEEIISIPIYQLPRIQVNDLNLPYQVYLGTPIWVYTDFYNMGRSAVNNLLVTLEGDFSGEGLSYFAGSFNQGASDYFEASIIPTQLGECKAKLTLSFEDEMGNQSEIVKEYTFTVLEAQSFDRPGYDYEDVYGEMPFEPGMEQAPSKVNLILIIGLSVVGVAVIVVLIIVIRKRKIKKKKGMNEDE